jgi:hypothetical protein
MLNEEFLKWLTPKANAFVKAIGVPMARGALFGNDRGTVQNVMKSSLLGDPVMRW